MNSGSTILTIGHSSHSREHFESLLTAHGVTAVADVRSMPFSRRVPQFNKDELKASLAKTGIAYSFLGRELGGRPKDAHLFCEGIADYELMAKTAQFQEGIERLSKGMNKFRIALLCSEHDPLDCHRCLLVARELSKLNIAVQHILGNGKLQDQATVENRLRALAGSAHEDFFTNFQEQLAAAYRVQSRKVAFSSLPRPTKAAAVR